MLLGTVIGHATSTIKHVSLTGWRLVIVQPLGANRQPDGDPQVAADKLGSAPGSTVSSRTTSSSGSPSPGNAAAA